MDSKLPLFLPLLFFFVHFHHSLSASRKTNSFESVPDLENSMYTQIDGYPCVRLLNISGEIGCSNPGRGKVVAPIVQFKNADVLVRSTAILVSADEFESLLSRVSKDPNFSRNVAGVLVEASTQVQNGLKGNSPDAKFPQAEFAPYKSNNFEWNPAGSGIMWKAFNFPVFLLSETSTPILQEAVLTNDKRKASYTEDVVEFDLVMDTTKSGSLDSDACLRDGACLPLGGYRNLNLANCLCPKGNLLNVATTGSDMHTMSVMRLVLLRQAVLGSVWSTLPPISISSSPKTKPLVLTVTSMDSASFFRDKSLGADSPISGLITLLAAVDTLSHVQKLDELNKQLVFLVLAGEAWGYLGSRRFLLESDQHSDAIKGLDMAMVETVMEIGSVGKSFSQGVKALFAHTSGDTSSVHGTLDALQRAQDSLKTDGIVVKRASTSNPGLPPSSLMTFLRKNHLTSGVVFEDFDSAFANKFYHSHLDDLSNVNSSAIVAATALIARTLYIAAGGNNDSVINSINVNASMVEELLSCLLKCEPGLSCDLVKHYISPSSTCPSHYVGVILGEPSSAPNPVYVGDVSRFVWNFLADKTSTPSKNMSSACPKDCNDVGELCIKTETDGKGVCVVSTTRYVPAYSTRLKYESGGWTLLPYNSSDIMSMEDPVWTESNWDTIGIRVYTVQDATYDHLILVLGIVITLLAYLLIAIVRTLIRKALKQD